MHWIALNFEAVFGFIHDDDGFSLTSLLMSMMSEAVIVGT